MTSTSDEEYDETLPGTSQRRPIGTFVMEPDEDREKPRSVSYIPRPFTSPSQPQYSGESFPLGERSRTTVSDTYGERTGVQPANPYGKYRSYEQMLEDMDEQEVVQDPNEPGASRPQTREFLRRGSGNDRLREKHERSAAIRKDLEHIPEKQIGHDDRPVKHRRRHKEKRRVREEPKPADLPGSTSLTGTYTKDSFSYTNPTYEGDNHRGTERSNSKAKYSSRKREGSRGRSKISVDDKGSTGTYTVEEKEDQQKLIKDETDLGTEKVVVKSMHKEFVKIDHEESLRRTGETLKKLRVDSRQTGFRSSTHRGHNSVKRTRAGLRYFIQNNIKHRQCKLYVQDPSKKGVCKCGRDIPWHIEEGVVVDLHNHRENWDSVLHTKEVSPTCYGEVFFNGFGRESKKTCPFVRITTDTSPDVVFKVMTDYWCLPPPKLLISVTGGAKQFHLKKRLNTVFKRGLIDAAKDTSAWIVTGGLNAGVMKMVGEAVREHQMSSGQAENIVSIGVATWGYVDNLEALEGDDKNGIFPAHYNLEDLSMRRGCAPLDQNHTHFILVDNGTEKKSGVEIPFRAAIEDYVSKKMETVTGVNGDGVNVPVVLLVLEGGMNTLKTAVESLRKNMPVVLIQGSGRAADFLAYAFKSTKPRAKDDGTDFPKDFDDRMRFRAANLFDWSRATEESKVKDTATMVALVRECLADRKLVTVYTLEDKANDSTDSKYIDKAILTALLKANKSNAATQLGLALAWNRCDMARQEIFTPENRPRWQHLQLSNAMFTALVQDRVDFVQLFLDMGVELKRFLTVRRLRDLYDEVLRDKYAGNSRDLLKNLIRELQSSLKHHFFCCAPDEWSGNSPRLLQTIGLLAQHLLGDMYQNVYEDEKYIVKDNAEDKERAIGQDAGLLLSSRSYDAVDGSMKHTRPSLKKRATKSNFVVEFKNPERELLIWSILLNRRELALMFWKAGKDHIGTALTASSLLKALHGKASDEEEIDLAHDLLRHSHDFEQIANGILTECYTQDKMKTHLALIRSLDNLGGSTCLSIADTGEHMEFMGNTACQTRLNKIWKGNMALYTSTWKICVAVFFPLIIPWIKFTRGDSGLGKVLGYKDDYSLFNSQRKVAPTSDEILDSGALEVVADEDDDYDNEGNAKHLPKKLFTVSFSGRTNSQTKRINLFRAILYFYTAPITKFIYTSLSYVVFLAIFSYMCLTHLYPRSHPDSPSTLEIIVWCWTSTLIVEEIRQIGSKDPRSLQYKLQGWFEQTWNKADLIMYTLFIVSVVLRYTLDDSQFHYARTGYAVTLGMFYIRFMQTFYVNKDIGPKVIMINRMLMDVFSFLAILAIFILCYGVGTHIILYPNAAPTWRLLKDVVYIPYWQMYGELFLERVEAQRDLTTCSTNRTLWLSDPGIEQCPEANAAAPIMFAIYMLLTNVLLLNLLIAMFSYTFQNVQDNSDLVWRYNRCSLFYEYFDRPTLAAPLIIITHIFRIFKYFIYHCCNKENIANHDFRVMLPEEDNDKVAEFEKLGMNNFLIKAEVSEREKITNRVANTGDRLDHVLEELEEIKDHVTSNHVEDEDKDDEGEKKQDPPDHMEVDTMQEVDALHDRMGGIEERLDIQGSQLIELISLMRVIIQEREEDRQHRPSDRERRYSERSESTVHRVGMPDRPDLDRGSSEPRRDLDRNIGEPHIEIHDSGPFF